MQKENMREQLNPLNAGVPLVDRDLNHWTVTKILILSKVEGCCFHWAQLFKN